jgi:hypothetical protein
MGTGRRNELAVGLLDGGSPNYESITVYLQETVYDEDGNLVTRPSATGIPAKASFQRDTQSRASVRLLEQADQGFESEEIYTMRFPRSFPHVLGLQAQVDWGVDANGNPRRWAVFGWPIPYNSSPRTKHLIYTVKRF